MKFRDKQYMDYVHILEEELIPAFGCTEPIALAYGAALVRDVLGTLPERLTVEVSGNIIKNVKSVIVPNTEGMVGIQAAVAAGIIAGEAQKKLEVIAVVPKEKISEIKNYVENTKIDVKLADSEMLLDIIITAYAGKSYSKVRICEQHTNVVLIEKDGEILQEKGGEGTLSTTYTDRGVLDIENIVEFADIVCLDDVRGVLERQISYNMAIAEEGMKNKYGANVGKVLISCYGDNLKMKAKAYAAAGSDARMNGCSLPVVICSGSGNQGITASVPVIVYARELHLSQENLLRALVVSNLVTIHQKTGIGRLSAYCGAVSAGCGSGAGIAYLLGGDYKEVAHTLVNSLAVISGIICDGAKASCAAKIATAVDAGILGYYMYKQGQQFKAGEGIVAKGVEENIGNISYLAKIGMKETDKEILYIMTGEKKE